MRRGGGRKEGGRRSSDGRMERRGEGSNGATPTSSDALCCWHLAHKTTCPSLSHEFVTCAFRASQSSFFLWCYTLRICPVSTKSVCCPVCLYPLLRYTHDVSFLSSSRVHLATVVLHTLRVSPVFSMRVMGWLTWFESRFCDRFLFILPSVMGEASVACFAGLVSAVRSAVSKWGAFLTRLTGELKCPFTRGLSWRMGATPSTGRRSTYSRAPPHRGRAIRCGAT